MRRKSRTVLFNGVIRSMACLALAYTVSLTPLYAQQIVTDGNTNTTLNVNGKVTNVSTTTIKGENAFNSFSRFNVNAGNVVNLNVPAASTRLINVVHNEVTNINGVLNSIKNGHIGGNVYLVNPNGIVVGPTGIINVGSCTALTPTKKFTDEYFTSPGNPSDSAVFGTINTSAPVNELASVNIQGKINAINDVRMETGSINNSGEIYSGAVFKENNISVGDVVNINKLESASNIAVNNGTITLHSIISLTNSGKLVADGGDNVNAGNIDLRTERSFTLTSTSLISAKGKGTNSNAGPVIISTTAPVITMSAGNTFDIRGGSTSGNASEVDIYASGDLILGGTIVKGTAKAGNRGTLNLNADNIIIDKNLYTDGTNLSTYSGSFSLFKNVILSTRDLNNPLTDNHETSASNGNSGNLTIATVYSTLLDDGSKILAFADSNFIDGTISIKPGTSLYSIKNTIYTKGSLTLNGGDLKNNSIIFTPVSLKALNINSDFIKPGTGINIVSNADVQIDNTNLIINNQAPKFPTVNINSGGNVIASLDNADNITIKGNTITVPANGKIKTNRSVNLNANDVFINGTVTMGSKDSKTFTINAANVIDPASNLQPLLVNGSLVFNNEFDLTQPKLNINGNLSGTGSIKLSKNTINISINNSSNYNLNIQKFASTAGDSQLEFLVNGVDSYYTENIGGVSVERVYNYDGIVSINNKSASNIDITGPIDLTNNGYLNADVFMNNTGGNIYASNGNNMINGAVIYLQAPNGAIGQINKPVNVLVQGLGFVTALAAEAKGDINIASPTGNMLIEKVISSAGSVNLTAQGHIYVNEGDCIMPDEPKKLMVEGKNISLWSKTGRIEGGLPNPLYDMVINVKGGQLYARAKGNILLTNRGGDLHIKNVLSEKGDTYLNNTTGNIIADHNATPKDVYEERDIMGTNLDINATGSITGPNKSTVKIVTNNGVDRFIAGGDINLTEYNSNTWIDLISNEGKGDIRIKTYANLMDMTDNSEAANIIGKNIFLDAYIIGGISDGKYDPEIQLKGGTLTAFAYHFIHINSYGDMLINAVSNAGRSDVSLTSLTGSILDGNASELPNIYAKTLVLNAPQGNIGTVTNDLNIQSNFGRTTDGFFSATAKGVINVTQYLNNLYTNKVESLTGDVKLFCDSSILDASKDELPNIIGKNINFNTVYSGSLGLYGDDLDIQLKGGSISAQAFGYINLQQTTGDLNIKLISNAGRYDVKLVSAGRIIGTTPGLLPSIYARGLTLDALSSGTIGDGSKYLVVDTNYNNAGGAVNILSKGLIQLAEYSGDLNLGVVSNAGRANVYLSAPRNILNTLSNGVTNIYSKNLYLYAGGGSVGLFGKPVYTDLNYNSAGGALTAVSNLGPVILTEKNNLIVNKLLSPFGSKYLKSGGLITFK